MRMPLGWNLHLRRAALAALLALAMAPSAAWADNGGIGFWLPGTMGSLSAVPGQPGMSYTFQYIHLGATAGGGKTLQNNANIVAGLQAKADVASSCRPTPLQRRCSAAS